MFKLFYFSFLHMFLKYQCVVTTSIVLGMSLIKNNGHQSICGLFCIVFDVCETNTLTHLLTRPNVAER